MPKGIRVGGGRWVGGVIMRRFRLRHKPRAQVWQQIPRPDLLISGVCVCFFFFVITTSFVTSLQEE